MTVLYLLRYFPTLTETFVNQEITAVAEQGVKAAVASLGSRADGALQDMVPQVPIHRLPRRSLGWQLRPQTRGQRWLLQHQRAKDAARLPGLLRIARDYDRIHVHFAGEAAELAHAVYLDTGQPYTVTVHAADLFKPRPSLVEVLSAAEHVLTISSFNQALLGDQGIEATVLRCGPDLERLKPRPLPLGPLRVIFIGRSVPKKGLPTLLEAWRELKAPNAQLSLVTDHAPARLPEGVQLLGLQPSSTIPELIAQHHLLSLPCQRGPDGDMDGLPLVLMEAMALGRPVITTPISGIPELVDPAVGWLHAPGDATGLAQALSSANQDRASIAARGAAGPDRLRLRGYHLQAQAQQMRHVWRQSKGIDEASTPSMAEDGSTPR
jgi:colanic acid/amylovoran biosynthesis glycosyltransferase